MDLPVELNRKIVDFLTSLPNIDDNNMQRVLIYSSGLDEELQHQIQFGNSAAQFSQLLVSTLRKYGKLKDGRNALVAVLEAAAKYVGYEQKEACNRIIDAVYTISHQKKT